MFAVEVYAAVRRFVFVEGNRGHDTKVSFAYVRQERTTNDRDWWWVQPVESGRCTSRVGSVTPVRTRRSAASLSADSAPD